MDKIIQNWKDATEAVAKVFTRKYFPTERYGKDTSWVGDEIGGIYCVSDYFFNIDRMLEALENDATIGQLIDYYDKELEYAMENEGKSMRINFRNYVRYGMLPGCLPPAE